jgi:HK97 family phage major capsid protein
MPNIEQILKTITTSAFTGDAGRMNAKQAEKFIDYMVDNSALMKRCTVVRMVADRQDLDYIAVGSRIMRKAVEATAPTDLAGVTHSKRQLAVTEVILPFDISFSYLEDNIEGDNIQDSLMRLFAQQYANDMEDLAINGLGTGVDPFLSIEAGWIALAKDANHTGVHVFDTNASTSLLETVFPGLVAQMPEKWKRNPMSLEIMVSPAREEAYRKELTARNTALGDSYLSTNKAPSYLGYTVTPIPTLPDSVYLFGNPKNLAMGIHARNMRVGKQIQERKRVVEVTITSRIDFEIIADDQLVIGYDAV